MFSKFIIFGFFILETSLKKKTTTKANIVKVEFSSLQTMNIT